MFFSCSDDDSNGIGNTALLPNKWKVVSVNNLPVKEYSGGDDIYLTFEEEGKFNITWVSSNDSESERGDWYWVDDYESVKIVYEGDLGTMKVDKLTSNELWLYKETENALFKCEAYFEDEVATENQITIGDETYSLNVGTHIWEGDPASGASGHYHSVVLATDINWFVHHFDDGKSIYPTGVGSYFYFFGINNNNQNVTEGQYEISYFYYAIDVEYDFWEGNDWDNLSQEDIDKYKTNEAKITEIEGEIVVKITESGEGYIITVSGNDKAGQDISATYTGSLETVDFRH